MRCGSEFSEARARLGFDCCLQCGGNEAAAEAARHACMIVPISHKSGYTYLGTDRTTQRPMQRARSVSRHTGPNCPAGVGRQQWSVHSIKHRQQIGAGGFVAEVVFVESKQHKQDRVRETQRIWLDSARAEGVSSFAIVEWKAD